MEVGPVRPGGHLAWSELACHDGTPYPAVWRADRAVQLATAFEAVRAACGGVPITILSAYRTPAHNAKVGGVPGSQHVQGRAIDLRPPAGLTPAQLEDVIRACVRAGVYIRGLGRYAWGCHLDIRPSNRLSYWRGTAGAGA